MEIDINKPLKMELKDVHNGILHNFFIDYEIMQIFVMVLEFEKTILIL